jgi:hypothetical protein
MQKSVGIQKIVSNHICEFSLQLLLSLDILEIILLFSSLLSIKHVLKHYYCFTYVYLVQIFLFYSLYKNYTIYIK